LAAIAKNKMSAKKIVLGTTSLIIGLIIFRFLFLPEPIKISYGLSGLSRRYYTTDNDNEPLDTSGIVKTIVFNGFFRFDDRLGKEDTKRLFSILLDSSNYEWGETGTPEFSKTLIYFDEKDEVKGETIFSYDGQTYTYPSNEGQSKWGHLNDEGLKAVMKLIK
jgi:hypothetical protein